MSTPNNSAARNAMSEFERKCYDWGWADAEERIIKWLENELVIAQHGNRSWAANRRLYRKFAYGFKIAIALIKGEQK